MTMNERTIVVAIRGLVATLLSAMWHLDLLSDDRIGGKVCGGRVWLTWGGR
jgi:hypothetical protein